ncbi:hypothetical protein DL95DRAFT_393136, partial [Leptodontidium sp. 2 PMI_412]
MSSPPFYTKSTPSQKPSLKLSHSPLSLPYRPSPSYHPSVSLPDRFDGAWAETISNHGGGPSLSSPNKNKNVFVSFIAFRCTSPSITSQAWASFTEKCEKLMLMQWEHEASEGADPEDMRRFFKIAWVEDVDVQQVHVDLGLLREKFQDVINDLKSQSSETTDIIFPSITAFLYIDDAAISSLLSPSSRQIPFVHAVNPGYEGFYDDDPLNPEAHYKIAIELLGNFWCL